MKKILPIFILAFFLQAPFALGLEISVTTYPKADKKIPTFGPYSAKEGYKTENTVGSGKEADAVGRVISYTGSRAETCTGTLVGGPKIRKNPIPLVLTAAHCILSDGDETQDKIFFLPEYSDGKAPKGVYQAKKSYIVNGAGKKTSTGDRSQDFAFLRLRGWEKLDIEPKKVTFSLPPPADFLAVGYPRDVANAEEARTCSGKILGLDTSFAPVGLKSSCYLAPGASGGPWISEGSVFGLTSYGKKAKADKNGQAYGITLSSEARATWRIAG